MLQLAAWWQCILQVLSSKSTKEQQYAEGEQQQAWIATAIEISIQCHLAAV